MASSRDWIAPTWAASRVQGGWGSGGATWSEPQPRAANTTPATAAARGRGARIEVLLRAELRMPDRAPERGRSILTPDAATNPDVFPHAGPCLHLLARRAS